MLLGLVAIHNIVGCYATVASMERKMLKIGNCMRFIIANYKYKRGFAVVYSCIATNELDNWHIQAYQALNLHQLLLMTEMSGTFRHIMRFSIKSN